ncbi:hypothetical protein K488DRAFT_58438, partial [Vararia minispora EC-137]
ATSVDAERAFSNGRRAVNFMQHKTSSNTFRARVCLKSWFDTPFLPNSTDTLIYLGGIIEKKTSESELAVGSKLRPHIQPAVVAAALDSDMESFDLSDVSSEN